MIRLAAPLFLLLLPIPTFGAIPQRRSLCAAALINTTVWFFGGFVQNSSSPDGLNSYAVDNTLWSLDLSKSWQLAFPPWENHSADGNDLSFVNPRAVSTLQAGINKETLLVYGGAVYQGETLNPLFDTLFVEYNIEKHTWSVPSVQGPSPSPLSGHSAVADNKGIVYYFGGLTPNLTTSPTSGSYLNNAVMTMNTIGYVYATLPVRTGQVGRFGHTATMVFGTKMYIIGGYSINSASIVVAYQPVPLSNIDVYDTILNTWTTSPTTGPTPSTREYHSAALTTDGSTTIVFGGYDNSSMLDDLWALDVNKFSWTAVQTKGAPPSARSEHNAVIVGAQMLIFFGASETYGKRTLYNEIHALDMSTTPWSWVENFTVPAPISPSAVPYTTSSASSGQITTPTAINHSDDTSGKGGIGVIGVGGLVGIIFGVIILLTAVGSVVWYYHRRPSEAVNEMPNDNSAVNEMPNDNSAVNEMPNDNNAGNEMPNDNSAGNEAKNGASNPPNAW